MAARDLPCRDITKNRAAVRQKTQLDQPWRTWTATAMSSRLCKPCLQQDAWHLVKLPFQGRAQRLITTMVCHYSQQETLVENRLREDTADMPSLQIESKRGQADQACSESNQAMPSTSITSTQPSKLPWQGRKGCPCQTLALKSLAAARYDSQL